MMKYLCVVSGSPGHIDFGGLGFVKLAQHLQMRGHKVEWATGCLEQIRRLETYGQIARLCPAIYRLRMKHFAPVSSSSTQDARDERQHRSLKDFFQFVQSTRPDILCGRTSPKRTVRYVSHRRSVACSTSIKKSSARGIETRIYTVAKNQVL